ncbi:hypothetical protein PVK06_042939 [Gossypium arboreum]|uniref:Uncharacterized protein n=1 Tax=Gossypium arboreum TaxID=29729 RepID=A0ABR0MMJ4_GOSAR|nr:hypothetical protein PVK06_042939 [Gossypium arboreum]
MLHSLSEQLQPCNIQFESLYQKVHALMKVSNIDDVDDQYAYQIVVNITGHVFNGFPFNQGPNSGYNMATVVTVGESSSSPIVIANMTTIVANANSNSTMAIASSLTTSDPLYV